MCARKSIFAYVSNKKYRCIHIAHNYYRYVQNNRDLHKRHACPYKKSGSPLISHDYFTRQIQCYIVHVNIIPVPVSYFNIGN